MEELLQVILQWGPRQQQLMIYLVAIEDPEKLERETRTGRRRVISGKWLSHLRDISLLPAPEFPFPSGSEAPNP